MGYFIDRLILGKEAADKIWATRFIVGFIGMTFGMGAGLIFICYWTYEEVALELSYQHQYGATWVAKFEEQHGLVSAAHIKIAIAVTSLVAIAAVLFWFFRNTFNKTKKRKRRHHRFPAG